MFSPAAQDTFKAFLVAKMRAENSQAALSAEIHRSGRVEDDGRIPLPVVLRNPLPRTVVAETFPFEPVGSVTPV